MRYVLLIIALFSINALNAQYGTTYHFHFTLQDSTTGFNSATDEHKVSTRKGGRRLVIKTKDYHYQVSSEIGYPLSAKDGKVSVMYAAIPPYEHFEITIQRRAKGTKEAFYLALIPTQDDDFAELHWQQDSLQLDLSYGENLIDYELVTPKTADGSRDLSCFLLAQCPPTFTITEIGQKKETARRVLKFEHIKYLLNLQIDSLISAHFPNTIFSQTFELECATGYYGVMVPSLGNCKIVIDTSLVGLRKLYKLAAPHLTTPFYMDIHSYEGQGAYFSTLYFGKKQFSRDELDFLPSEEIAQFAKEQFPDVDFIIDENGLPMATLIYLAEQPRNTTENHRYPFDLGNIPTEKDTSTWPGTFAYCIQRPLPMMGHLNGYERYYFYAHKARFILKTENYYDLIDE
jgi:hypothetical protein